MITTPAAIEAQAAQFRDCFTQLQSEIERVSLRVAIGFVFQR